MHTYTRVGILVLLVLSIAQLSNVYRQQQLSLLENAALGTETAGAAVKGAAPFDGFCAWRDGGTLQNCTQLLAEPTSSAKKFYFLGDSTIFRL